MNNRNMPKWLQRIIKRIFRKKKISNNQIDVTIPQIAKKTLSEELTNHTEDKVYVETPNVELMESSILVDVGDNESEKNAILDNNNELLLDRFIAFLQTRMSYAEIDRILGFLEIVEQFLHERCVIQTSIYHISIVGKIESCYRMVRKNGYFREKYRKEYNDIEESIKTYKIFLKESQKDSVNNKEEIDEVYRDGSISEQEYSTSENINDICEITNNETPSNERIDKEKVLNTCFLEDEDGVHLENADETGKEAEETELNCMENDSDKSDPTRDKYVYEETSLEIDEEVHFENQEIPEILSEELESVLSIKENNLEEIECSDSTSNNVDEKVFTRSEKASMYEDKTQLILKDINPKYLEMLKEIPEVDNFSKLRNRIMREFPNVKLLCEIEVNDEEFKILCTYFRKKYVHIRRDIEHAVVDVLFSVAMVQIGIRYYDGNFWSHIVKVLGITRIESLPYNQRSWLGGTVTETLLAFGKPVYSPNEYVINILMHGFVVDTFASRFFDYLFQYYNIDLQRDFSGMNEDDLEDLCASIKNPYGMRKQLLSKYMAMSIRGDSEYCKEIIYKSIQLIDQSFWDEYTDEQLLTGRLLEKFEEWKGASHFYKNEKKRLENILIAGNRIKVHRKPYLKCDLEKSIFEIVLPSQMLRKTQNIDGSSVNWQIFSSAGRTEINCSLEEGYSGLRTKEIRITAENDQIFNDVYFILFENNEAVKRFAWKNRKINFFNEEGHWFAGEHLTVGSYFGFTQEHTKVKSKALLAQSYKNGMNFYEFEFYSGDIVNVEGEGNYYIGKVPGVGLTNEHLCQNVWIYDVVGKKYDIYKKIPSFVVDVSDEQLNGTAIIVNGQTLRMSENDFLDVRLGNTDDKKYYFVNLSNCENIKDGINNIIIDFPRTQRTMHAEFAYLSELTYEYEDAPYLFQSKGTLSINRRIEKKIIRNSIRVEKQNYDFSIEDLDTDYIEFPIEFEHETLKIRFSVPMLSYSWDKKNWHTQLSSDIWHSDLPDILYMKYPDSKAILGINSIGDMYSTYTYNKNVHGIIECDLTKIKSYFYDGSMIKKVKLIVDTAKYDLLRIILRSHFLGATMETDYDQGRVVWRFDIIGQNVYFADVFCDGELIIEKESIIDGIIESQMQIKSAEYIVKVYEMEDEFGFDEEYDFVGQSVANIINPNELTGSCMKINLIRKSNSDNTPLALSNDYYLFITEKDTEPENEGLNFIGMLTGVFHNDSVVYASKVCIQVLDAKKFNSVSILFIDENGDRCELLYDSYTKSITEKESSRLSKSEAYRRYLIIYSDYVWEVQYIEDQPKIKKQGNDWLSKHETRQRNISFQWKENIPQEMTILALDLSAKTYNCLKRAKLTKVDQIVGAYRNGALKNVRNLDNESYKEILSKLQKRRFI